jgi:hypothetical protein
LSSWVQLQLQNHPLEIWEDGLKDYMSHASEIMVSLIYVAISYFFLLYSYKCASDSFLQNLCHRLLLLAFMLA